MKQVKNATNDHRSYTKYIKKAHTVSSSSSNSRNRKIKKQQRVKSTRIEATKTQVARVHTQAKTAKEEKNHQQQ